MSLLKHIRNYLFILIIFSVNSSFAAILYVPSQYSNIQSALNAAAAHDTILVSQGTYTGGNNYNLSNNSKPVIIVSIDGAPVTTIDVEGNTANGFNVSKVTNDSVIIVGFTIKNASSGVYCESNATVKLINCVFTDNSIGADGLSYNSRMNISNCQFRFNTKGIATVNAIIESCELRNNSPAIQTRTTSYKAAVLVSISGCTFSDNLGALDANDSGEDQVYINNCSFTNNTYVCAGGFILERSTIIGPGSGFSCYAGQAGSRHTVLECTISGLTGAAFSGSGRVLVIRSTIHNNSGSIATSNAMELSYFNIIFNRCVIKDNNSGMHLTEYMADVYLNMINTLYVNNADRIHIDALSTAVQIDKCTFYNNTNGALAISAPDYSGSYYSIDSSIFAYNNGPGLELPVQVPPYLTINCSNFFQNSGGNYVNMNDQTGINGNISVNPLFCDTANDNFYLFDISQCLPDNNSCNVQMGAFYGHGCLAPDLQTSQSSLVFQADILDPIPSPKSILISSTGIILPIDSITKDSSWLSANPISGSTPRNINVSVNMAGKPIGTYQDVIKVYSIYAANSPLEIPVTVIVDDNNPILDVSHDTVIFIIPKGKSDTSFRVLTILNEGTGSINWSIVDITSESWLIKSPSSGTTTTSDICSLGVYISSLDTGSYFALFSVDAGDAGSQDVRVNLMITNAELDSLTLSPQDLNLPLGLTQQYSVTGYYSDATMSDISDAVSIWSSTNELVASIDHSGLAQTTGIGNTQIIAEYNTKADTVNLTVESAVMTSIWISGRDTMAVGESSEYQLFGHYTDDSDSLLGENVNWESTQETIAIIDVNTGNATAIDTGSTTIKATYADTISDQISLTVIPPQITGISLKPRDTSIYAEDTLYYIVSAAYTNNDIINLSNLDTLSWFSESSNIASINNGMAIAIEEGVTLIKADIDGVRDSTTLSVEALVLVDLEISSDKQEIDVLNTTQCYANGVYQNQKQKNLTSTVDWSSSNTSVADVSSYGLITSKICGFTYIKASFDGFVDSVLFSIVPNLDIDSPTSGLEIGQSYTLNADITGDATDMTGWLYYRVGGATDYDSVSMLPNSGQLSGVIPDFAIGIRGVEYYISAKQNGQQSFEPALISDTTVIVHQTSIANTDAPLSIPAQEHKMIGFPFNVSPSSFQSTLVDQLGEPDPTRWRFGRWNHLSQGYDEYANVGSLTWGHGYWLISKNAADVNLSGTSAVPESTYYDNYDTFKGRYAVIDLLPGWNQISTPFAFDIDWDLCFVDNGNDESIWKYRTDINNYVYSGTMVPFEGYFLYNELSTTKHLYVIYNETSKKTSIKLNVINDNEWTLNFIVSSGSAADVVNTMGVNVDASDELDQYDFKEPPPFGKYISSSFIVNDSSGNVQFIGGDIKSPTVDFWKYDFLVRGNTSDRVTLEIENLGFFNPSYNIFLIDSINSISTELRLNHKVLIQNAPDLDGHKFSILIGQDVSSKTELDLNLLPDKFKLYQNYPNPFNPETHIEFDLPKEVNIAINIYNLLGQKVKTLIDKKMKAGHHSILWNGIDENGSSVSSGIYFYQLVSPDHMCTKKMTIIK